MADQPQEDVFAHSLTDLMAGVAAIFVVIAVIFILMAESRARREEKQRQVYQTELQDLHQFREMVLMQLDELGEEIKADKALSEFVSLDEEARKKDPFLFVVIFSRQKLLFLPSHCDLSPDQDKIVSTVGQRVLEHVCKFAEHLEKPALENVATTSRATLSMTLEGHTDQRPFYPTQVGCGIDHIMCGDGDQSPECKMVGFNNNVRLSAARAQNVFFVMRQAVINDLEKSLCLEKYFVVAGRGPVEPVGNSSWRVQQTAEVNEKNRRVVLKIRAQPLFSATP